MNKDVAEIIGILILILTILNGFVYIGNMVKLETKNSWGSCSIRYSDDPSENSYQREKCMEKHNQSINKAENYMSNFGKFAKYIAIAFIIASAIMFTIPNNNKVISIVNIIFNVIILLL